MLLNLLFCLAVSVMPANQKEIDKVKVELNNVELSTERLDLYFKLYLLYVENVDYPNAGQALFDYIQTLKNILFYFNEVDKSTISKKDMEQYYKLYDIMMLGELELSGLLFLVDDNYGASEARAIPIYKLKDIKFIEK